MLFGWAGGRKVAGGKSAHVLLFIKLLRKEEESAKRYLLYLCVAMFSYALNDDSVDTFHIRFCV